MGDTQELIERGMPERVKLCEAGEWAIEIDPTNHHNAVHCPHCNPDNRFVWADAEYVASLQRREKKLREALVERLAPDESLPAPCALCGHNGPDYFQPDNHSCAGNANWRARQALEDTDSGN